MSDVQEDHWGRDTHVAEVSAVECGIMIVSVTCRVDDLSFVHFMTSMNRLGVPGELRRYREMKTQ